MATSDGFVTLLPFVIAKRFNFVLQVKNYKLEENRLKKKKLNLSFNLIFSL